MSATVPPEQSADATTNTRYVYKYHNDSLGPLNLLLLGLVALVALFIGLVLVQIMTEPDPVHFALNDNAQIIEPVPLSQEGITTAALLNWVNEFVMKAFSFNYSNVDKQAAKLAPYFSDAALKMYSDLLTTDQDFKSIGDNKFVVSVVPRSAPEILVGKSFQDRYAWQIQVRANIIFQNSLLKGQQDVEFNFLVWRISEREFPLGITVATFNRTIKGRTGAQNVRGF